MGGIQPLAGANYGLDRAVAQAIPRRTRFFRSTAGVLGRPLARHSRTLFIGGEASIKHTLLFRAALVGGLLLAVTLTFWLDRDGLYDTLDGHVSFLDAVYFTMVTVTTVGYGDIVPVTTQARLVDALFVTPVRMVVWFIFLGTAYQLVIRKIVEEVRMKQLQESLRDHIVICGYGDSGRSAVRELLAQGESADRIVVVDIAENELLDAADIGCIGLRGDATREEVVNNAGVQRARCVIVATGRDDTTVLIVLTIRHVSPATRIIAKISSEENEKLARQAGADFVLVPAMIGGTMLADAVSGSGTVRYLIDLMSMRGDMRLVERPAQAAEVGRRVKELERGLVVRITREGRSIKPWIEPDAMVRQGDVLLLLEDYERSG